jgi:hypothetical protein
MPLAAAGIRVPPRRTRSWAANHGSATKTIGHWIVGHGYTGSGVTGYYADPATSVWANVAPKFAYTTAGFERYVIKAHGNGLVY